MGQILSKLKKNKVKPEPHYPAGSGLSASRILNPEASIVPMPVQPRHQLRIGEGGRPRVSGEIESAPRGRNIDINRPRRQRRQGGVIQPENMPNLAEVPRTSVEEPRTPNRVSAEFKKGGLVKKTGLAKVHKGELVIPANRVKAVEKAVKDAGLKPLKK